MFSVLWRTEKVQSFTKTFKFGEWQDNDRFAASPTHDELSAVNEDAIEKLGQIGLQVGERDPSHL